MTERSGLGVLTADGQLLIRSWNDWLEAASGTTEPAVLGTPLLDRLPAARRAMFKDVFDEVLASGTIRVLAPAFHHYLIACAPRGASAHFTEMQQRVTIAPLLAEGAAVGLIITIEDVTSRLDEERTLANKLHAGTSASRDALAALRADDWKVRGAAVRALKPSVAREEIAHLIGAFQRDHDNLSVLSSALQVLVAAGRNVTPALIELLEDAVPNIRMHAALALGELRADDAVAALIRALRDDDTNVRFHAIEALGRIGARDATEPLAAIACAGDFFLSFAAIDAIAHIEDALVEPILIGLLDNELLRAAAVDALAATGDEDAVEPLARLLDDEATEVGPVAAALDRIRTRYEDSLGAGAHIVDLARGAIGKRGRQRLIEAVRRREQPLAAVVSACGWIGPEAIDGLIAAFGEPGIEASLGEAICANGSAAVPALIDALSSDSRDARLSAAALLGRLGDSRAVPALIDLLSLADIEATNAACGALGRIGDARALEAILALLGHERSSVRQSAIAAVNAIGAEETSSRIRELVKSGDPRVRESALRIAGYFGFPDCLPLIVAAIEDPEEDVRRAAIEQLAVIEDPRATSTLIHALQHDNARNRAAAAHAMRGAAAGGATAALIAALDDGDTWVRYFAASSLGRLGDSRAAAAVTRLAERDPAVHVQIAAIQALETLDPRALVRLASGMSEETTSDVMCAALAGLASASGFDVDDILDRAAESPRPSVRAAAIQALAAKTSAKAANVLAWSARLTEPASIPTLAVDGLRRIASSDDEAGRHAAVHALLDLGVEQTKRDVVLAAFGNVSATAIDTIASHLQSPAVPVRLMAVHALARMRRPAASQAPSLKRNSAWSNGAGASRSSPPSASDRANSPVRSATRAASWSSRTKAPTSAGRPQRVVAPLAGSVR